MSICYQLKWNFSSNTTQPTVKPEKPKASTRSTFTSKQKSRIKELYSINKPALSKLCKAYGFTISTIDQLPAHSIYQAGQFICSVIKAINAAYYNNK